MVYQERSLVGALSVAENVYAGRQPVNAAGIIRRGPMNDGTRRILAELEVELDPRAPVASLSPGQQQMVEIAKGLSHELKVLILDEPTSSLTINEGRHLFRVIRRLAAQGVAIIYVSHRMAEVFEISDRVTVMKDGRVTGVRETSVGYAWRADRAHGRARALVRARSAPRRAGRQGGAGGTRARGRAGGLCIILRSATARSSALPDCLAPGAPKSARRFSGRGRSSPAACSSRASRCAPHSPADSMAAGISMLPEDRKESGLFMDFSIAANVVAANLPAYTHSGLLSRSEMRAVSQKYKDELRIATPSIDREVRNLSGGNQQKVLLAKWLARHPRILIVDEPTRGVDVGSKADIYRILRDLAASGIALLVVSSDLPEVLALAHRIVVMSEGRVAGELDAASGDRNRHPGTRRTEGAAGKGSMSSNSTALQRRRSRRPGGERDAARSRGKELLVRIATERQLLLIVLIVVLIVGMTILEPNTFPRRRTPRSCCSTRPRPASSRAG